MRERKTVLSLLLLTGFLAPSSKAENAFAVVRDGASQVVAVVPDYPEGLSDVSFFTNAVFRCTGASLLIAESCSEVKGGENRIVFQVEKRPLLTEDDWRIDFPDDKTLRITGTDKSCRWAINWILEEQFGCCFCFPGKRGTYYPRTSSLFVPRESKSGTMSLKLQRDLWREDPAWQRAMGGKKARGNFMGHNLNSFLPVARYAQGSWREKIMPEIDGRRIVPKQAGAGWNNCYASEESVSEAVRNICAYLREHPEENVYALSVNDGGGHCSCAGCREMNGGRLDARSRFGGHTSVSVAYYKWVNRVATGVAAEFPDVMLGLLAYRNTIDPPGFKLHPNVVPFLCIDTSQLVEPTRVENRRQLFTEWSWCVQHFGQWDYAYGMNYTPARIYLKTMDRFFKWKRDFPAFGGVFAEGDSYVGEGPKRWWHYKLMANTEADVNEMLGKWYVACCGKSAARYLKAYYDLLESFWSGQEIRKTPWFKTNDHTYLNFTDRTYLYALADGLMLKANELIEKVVECSRIDGDEDQRWRASVLRGYQRLYAKRCVWNGAGRGFASGRFASADDASAYIRALPEMCDACKASIRMADRLEDLHRTELGRSLPFVDLSRKNHYVGWGAEMVYNPNFHMLMNGAIGFLGNAVFVSALEGVTEDSRLLPCYARTLKSLVDLASAEDCAYGDVKTADDDRLSWTRRGDGPSTLMVDCLDGRRYRLRRENEESFEACKHVSGLKRGYYLLRTRLTNKSSNRVRISSVYYSSSPTYTDMDSFGVHSSVAIPPGESDVVSVFCRASQSCANLCYRIHDLPKGECVVVEKIELLLLGEDEEPEVIAEAANPGRMAAALASSERALKIEREERKMRFWAMKTGLTVEEFKALDPDSRKIAMQAFSCFMTYADYMKLSPEERRVKREECMAIQIRKSASSAESSLSQNNEITNGKETRR